MGLKAAGAAHGAMVAGLASRLDAANLFFLKKIYQLSDGCFFHAKLFLTRM
jgi:hypothetical protein